MSEWNAHHSLTLRDREGKVVYIPSSVNAGRHVVADSDSGSVVRRNAANHARSRSPAVVQVRYLFQPPPPPRRPRETSYPLPALPMPVLPASDGKGSWAQAPPFPLLSRTNTPPPPPSQRFHASTCSARPQVMKKQLLPAKQQRPCDRLKKVQRKEKCGIAVAHHSSEERSLQQLTHKKALWKKRQLSQPKADARTVAAPAVKRRKENACRIATGVPVVAGSRAYGSQTKTYSSCVKSLEPLSPTFLSRQLRLSASLRLQCLQYPLHCSQGYQRVH